MHPGALDLSKKGYYVCESQRPERENKNGGHRGVVEPRFFWMRYLDHLFIVTSREGLRQVYDGMVS